MKQQFPKKSLGQNFLHDANVAQKIVRAFSPQNNDFVIEIGPGKGALTSLLLNSLPHITAVELDDDLAAGLKSAYNERITIIHDDVLNVNFTEVAHGSTQVRIIGNIPYNITTPILFHVIEYREVVKDFLVMMQSEVAQRIAAKPRTKEYGILSVFLQYYCTPKILFAVSKNSFFPVPSVSSTIVHLDFQNSLYKKAEDDRLFRKIVRGTFGIRRKTLRNGLRQIGLTQNEYEHVSINLDQRPEELTVREFVELSDELQKYGSKIIEPETEEMYG